MGINKFKCNYWFLMLCYSTCLSAICACLNPFLLSYLISHYLTPPPGNTILCVPKIYPLCTDTETRGEDGQCYNQEGWEERCKAVSFSFVLNTFVLNTFVLNTFGCILSGAYLIEFGLIGIVDHVFSFCFQFAF